MEEGCLLKCFKDPIFLCHIDYFKFFCWPKAIDVGLNGEV